MHLCNLARCQHSKGNVFINFEGEISWMTIPFFLVDANMQASQNYGTTTGTAARVLRPSTEYQWSLLGLPAPKIFTIIKIMFFPEPACTFFRPPSKCQFIDKCAKWPTPSGECKMYKLCKQVRKTHSSYHHQHRYQKVINIITLVFQRMIAKCATFATKNEKRPSRLFCIFLFLIASLPVEHIQVEKKQRPCVWTPTLWSTAHLCTNLTLARSRLAFFNSMGCVGMVCRIEDLGN